MTDLQERLEAAVGDRYRVQRELGRGGMAIVYLAEDLKHHRRVAVKVLQPEITHAVGSERFLREIEIAAQLSHPNILPLHDSGAGDGLLYYVMPYVAGESLRGRLEREKQLPLEDALQITREAADALAYAHSRGIVHRDIKPENILFQSGHAVVSDFGIARAIGKAGGERLTDTGLALGTPIYMSPEQASGEHEIDARTDIYSLGCLLYEMLAGSPPYTGANAQAIFARKVLEPVPSLRVVRNTVPVDVERVIARALAKAPADRFATAAEFSAELDRAASSRRTAGALPQLSTRRRVAVISAVLAIMLAGGGWWLAQNVLADSGRLDSLVVLPFDNLSRDTAQEYFVAGMHDALISELAQIGALRVISRTSAHRYRNTEKSVSEIARELNVDGVVEASVFRSGDSVRIRVQLIRARPTEQHVRAWTYDRNLRQVLALHSDVASAVAREIKVGLTPFEQTRLASAPGVEPQAYTDYLKGMFHYYRLTRADLDAAEGYFERALQKDPNYALAYTGMARLWGGRQQMGFVSPRIATPKARSFVLRALALDSTLAEAHAALAGIKTWGDWDWVGGEREFRQAIALNPNAADARAAYSHLLGILGRHEEARAQIERALELDPFNAFIQAFYGGYLMHTRRYDDAIIQGRKALTTSPGLPVAHGVLVNAFYQKGMHRESIAQMKAGALAAGDRDLEQALDRGWAEGGYREAMRRAAETLAVRSLSTNVRGQRVASMYIRAGDKDRTLEWLERAYKERDPNLPYLGVQTMWDPVREDPRFQDLLRRLKLPQWKG
jgi:serine/threonine protein kinase/Tfp pilus assembly protein PilF